MQSEEEEKLRGRILDSIFNGDNYENKISHTLGEGTSSVYQALKALEKNCLVKEQTYVSDAHISDRRRTTRYPLTPYGVKAVEIRGYIMTHNTLFPALYREFPNEVLLINLLVAIGVIKRLVDDRAMPYTEWDAHRTLCRCGRTVTLGQGLVGVRCENCGTMYVRECFSRSIAVPS